MQDHLKVLNEAETVAYIYGDTETARRLAQLAEELKSFGEPDTNPLPPSNEVTDGGADSGDD